MNTPKADAPLGPPGEGWNRRKIFSLTALAVVAHLGLIYTFGTHQQIVPRAVGPVPHLRLAENHDEVIALADPTLFALPHANDFASGLWQRIPAPTATPFRWTEPPQFLPLAADELGAAFQEFVRTNRFAEAPVNFKPEPVLGEAALPFEFRLPKATTLQISGDLAHRPRLNTVPLPSLPYNDVIQPSEVQVLVNPAGRVDSAVLLDSSTYPIADQTALQLAVQLRFAPAARLMFGKIVFHWHTVPVTNSNTP